MRSNIFNTAKPEKPLLVLHRFGFFKTGNPHTGWNFMENTFTAAVYALEKSYIDGGEIDIDITKDGKAVVFHALNTQKMLFEDILKNYPGTGSLESWCEWIEYVYAGTDRILYLDLKSTRIDEFSLVKYLTNQQSKGKYYYIGTMHLHVAQRLLIATNLLGCKSKIILQIPFPVLPKNIVKEIAVSNQKLMNFLHQKKIKNSGIFGLHFFFTDSLIKELRTLPERHGNYVQLSDWIEYWIQKLKGKKLRFHPPHIIPDQIGGFYFKKSSGPQVIPNIFLIHNIQLLIIWRFLHVARKYGFKVITGSTNSRLTMRRLKDFFMIMPNSVEQIPENFIEYSKYRTKNLTFPTSVNKTDYDFCNHAESKLYDSYSVLVKEFNKDR